MATSDHPTPVSPFLDRPGLDPTPAPEPNLHLFGGIWVASCATCGYQLCESRRQDRCERKASWASCPVCSYERLSNSKAPTQRPCS